MVSTKLALKAFGAGKDSLYNDIDDEWVKTMNEFKFYAVLIK